MFFHYLITFMLTIQSGIMDSKEISEPIQQILQSYQDSIDTSVTLDKTDNDLVNVWLQDFQMRQLNLTTEYRVQMIRHKDHNFRWNPLNSKWQQCTHLFKTQVKSTEHGYYEKENECLRMAMVSDKGKKEAINQIKKEIRKWRKGYRYLNHLCNTNNAGDDAAAGVCLVDYIQRNEYHETLQRLLSLKQEAMRELLTDLNNSTSNLEECLRICLSEYLSDVRSVMGILNRCYNGRTDVNIS